jgi:5'-3' exoribonuclease 1
MGVLRLFRYYLNKFGKNNFYRIASPGNDAKHDVLLLDLNAIFHPCCREVFAPEKRFLRKAADPPFAVLKQRAFEKITLAIEELCKVANPSRAIYFAIDGVAGCCKQAQQRKRRFMGARQRKIEENRGFDFAALTCGTEFMQELNDYLKEWIKTKSQGEWYRLRLVFNGVDIPGEGEHKLIRWIETNADKFKTYCIYSPDADLLMLGMLVPVRLFVLRENIYNDIQGRFLNVDLQRLKALILEDMRHVEFARIANTEDDWDTDRVIRDYVLFLFMLGNDFLPTVQSLDIASQGIDILVKIYCDTHIEKGYLLDRHMNLDKAAFESLLEKLVELEPYLIVKKYMMTKTLTPDLLTRKYIRFNETEELDFEGYRKEYYETKFPELKEKSKLCEEYISGLDFVIKYYSSGIPTFKWSFDYHYAPLFIDLLEWSKHQKSIAFNWKFAAPLHSIENLVSVLPPSSFHLLPEGNKLREYVSQYASLDSDFSEEFQVDYEGKKEEYEGIPLIPNLDYDKAKTILKKFKLKSTMGMEIDIRPARKMN